ncbi:hypothetical protein [Panacagrimonas sp.]|uniref:hypothetical protein n=1 Tax=Panacagrimonas sp. TaxID=2480088 RepID=UPI003B528F8B
MPDTAIRINARLSGEDARRFKELEALEGSATNVIREAVREYHSKRVKPRRNAYEIMIASGFIGSVTDGNPDSSSKPSVRAAMDEALRRKFPHAYEHEPVPLPKAESARARKPRSA